MSPCGPATFLERYLRGDRERVWTDLRDLGSAVRDESLFADAWGVAVETMRRVRDNVDILHRRLQDVGYQFHQPERAHAPPEADAATRLDTFETRHGPLPLSLRAFYEIVGTVDFRQSWTQLADRYLGQNRAVASVEYLGAYDPLVVEPLVCEDAVWDPDHGRRAWFLAPDECHKANHSVGMNYHVLLPDAGADFRIYGMPTSEGHLFGDYFVGYLRETFSGGGFRGVETGDDGDGYRKIPDFDITRRLAEGLRPIGTPPIEAPNNRPQPFGE
ncbi:hypothetical protein [Rugosimonospora africana]|uniref:Uncharacterized protein n=1 Tax=Rugosimonospora africana TaxID=556532 RepID=A0A8J3R1Z1_9ACTN|nr:hypothetical protein [Rugosimonospora africana]GIH20761.1 hypothetical protein Raf01_89330 [Rugosimonospora africana]